MENVITSASFNSLGRNVKNQLEQSKDLTEGRLEPRQDLKMVIPEKLTTLSHYLKAEGMVEATLKLLAEKKMLIKRSPGNVKRQRND
jgi:hypothetical protein